MWRPLSTRFGRQPPKSDLDPSGHLGASGRLAPNPLQQLDYERSSQYQRAGAATQSNHRANFALRLAETLLLFPYQPAD